MQLRINKGVKSVVITSAEHRSIEQAVDVVQAIADNRISLGGLLTAENIKNALETFKLLADSIPRTKTKKGPEGGDLPGQKTLFDDLDDEAAAVDGHSDKIEPLPESARVARQTTGVR